MTKTQILAMMTETDSQGNERVIKKFEKLYDTIYLHKFGEDELALIGKHIREALEQIRREREEKKAAREAEKAQTVYPL